MSTCFPVTSVSDPGFFSRIRLFFLSSDPDPDFKPGSGLLKPGNKYSKYYSITHNNNNNNNNKVKGKKICISTAKRTKFTVK